MNDKLFYTGFALLALLVLFMMELPAYLVYIFLS